MESWKIGVALGPLVANFLKDAIAEAWYRFRVWYLLGRYYHRSGRRTGKAAQILFERIGRDRRPNSLR